MSSAILLSAVAQISSGDGLTFQEVLADLPHDPASLFVIALLLGSMALVLWTGRPRGGGGSRPV